MKLYEDSKGAATNGAPRSSATALYSSFSQSPPLTHSIAPSSRASPCRCPGVQARVRRAFKRRPGRRGGTTHTHTRTHTCTSQVKFQCMHLFVYVCSCEQVFVSGDACHNAWNLLTHQVTDRPMVHELMFNVSHTHSMGPHTFTHTHTHTHSYTNHSTQRRRTKMHQHFTGMSCVGCRMAHRLQPCYAGRIGRLNVSSLTLGFMCTSYAC